MQKKLIALAIAGLAAAPAFAQTNVTIYGVADLTEEYVDGKGADNSNLDIQGRSRLTSNSSLLGFRGTEDLGNGLKAIFQFETGISADTGMGTTFSARDTFVGLTSGWGTIVGGNLTAPIRNMGAKVSMSPGATGIGFTAATYGTILGLHTGSDDRAPNSVAYITPALMGGLTFTGAYVNGESKRNSDTVTSSNNTLTTTPGTAISSYAWQFGVQYEAGPLYLGGGYHQANDPQILSSVASVAGVSASAADIGSFSDKLKVWRLAGTYKFGFGMKIAGLWDNQKYEFDSASLTAGSIGSGDVERDAWQLGISQDFGAHTIYGEYSQANKASVSGDEDFGDTKIKQYTIGYNYNLSKRTMLKAYYTEIRQGEDSAADFYLTPVGNSTQALGQGADPKGFGVGLRHVF